MKGFLLTEMKIRKSNDLKKIEIRIFLKVTLITKNTERHFFSDLF